MQVASLQVAGKRGDEQEQQPSKAQLFESVIGKYFEIIKTILPRISSLYLENEEFERNLYVLQSKMTKIQADQENLHYEIRANQLSIDNKLNHLSAEYTNISNDYCRIKQQNEELYNEIKEIRYMQFAQKEVYTDRQEEPSQFRKDKGKKITFCEEQGGKEPDPTSVKSKKSLRFLQRKSSINLEELQVQPQEDQVSQGLKSEESRLNIEHDSIQSVVNSKAESQKLLNFSERNGRIAMKSEKVMVRKANLKSTARINLESSSKNDGPLSKTQSIFAQSSEQMCSEAKCKQILREIQDFYKKNQHMNKNYEYLMSEYCRNNEEQYSKLQAQIQQLKTKITEIDLIHTHFEKIKIQLESKMSAYHKDTDLKLTNKLDVKRFNEHIIEANARLTGVHEERKKLANKEETKRAIEFLEAKLNYVITEMLSDVAEKYPKLHLVELEISHLSSKFKSLPISKKKKTSFYTNLCDRKTSNQNSNKQGQSCSSAKRQAQSVHFNIISDKMITEDQTESCSLHKDKAGEGNFSMRNKKQKLAYLRDRSRQLLSRADNKTKPAAAKLRKERILFSYD